MHSIPNKSVLVSFHVVFVTFLTVAFAFAFACVRRAAPPDAQVDETIACQLGALTAEERAQHAALLRELGAMTQSMRETERGYALSLRADAPGFEKVAAWITLERRCCPFLEFALAWNGRDTSPTLTVGGGPGAKAFLAAEMQDEKHGLAAD
jgi:hypothetical protein